MNLNGCFTRDFELDNRDKTITFYQKEVGDVSCVVWDASLVLARYLEKKANEDPSWLKGCTVVELGAGVGCAGIVAACCGAHVIMTDLPEVLPLLKHNISVNRNVWLDAGGQAKAEELNWGQSLPNVIFPKFIILADCVYYTESIKPLVDTLCLLANSKTEVLLCQEERETDKQKKVWKEFLSEVPSSKRSMEDEKFQARHWNGILSSKDFQHVAATSSSLSTTDSTDNDMHICNEKTDVLAIQSSLG